MPIKITIITSIYNKSKYLSDYVQSIKSQTFKDFEVICVDDCSTDDSLKQLQILVSNDSRFNIIINEENCGLSVSRNKAIELSKGKYICFLDADDCFVPQALEILWETAEKYGVEAVFFSALEYSDDLKKKLRTIKYKRTYPVCDGKKLIALLHDNKEYQSACGFQLWNLEFLKNNNARFYPGIYYEDTLFTIQTLIKAKCVKAIPDTLYIYRQCSSSISHTLGIKQLYSCLAIYDELSIMSKQNYNDEYIYNEIIERLHLFKRRIEHIICIEPENSINILNYAPYNDLLQKFVKNRTYPYIRELLDEEISKIRLSESVFVYGDGVSAEETVALLSRYQINICAIIVSYTVNDRTWHGYKVIALDEFNAQGLVIISVSKKWKESLEEAFELKGNDTIFITRDF